MTLDTYDTLCSKKMLKNLWVDWFVVNLTMPNLGCTSEPLARRSQIKINSDLFCISFGLHYLCKRKENKIWHKEVK